MKIRVWAILVFIVIAGFVSGLWVFKNNLPIKPSESLAKADAIVVLTGGELRIKTGFELLNKKVSDVLFITGVHSKSRDEKLFKHYEKSNVRGQVYVGKWARNTTENAMEFLEFNEKHNFAFKTIYLVTDYFHMQRSLLEFRYFNKNVTLLPYPVKYEGKDRVAMFFREFVKYYSANIWHLLRLEAI